MMIYNAWSSIYACLSACKHQNFPLHLCHFSYLYLLWSCCTFVHLVYPIISERIVIIPLWTHISCLVPSRIYGSSSSVLWKLLARGITEICKICTCLTIYIFSCYAGSRNFFIFASLTFGNISLYDML